MEEIEKITGLHSDVVNAIFPIDSLALALLVRSEKHSIGVVVEDFRGLGRMFKTGQFVLLHDDTMMTYTVERPLSLKEIRAERIRGSLITTVGTIINVPLNLIRVVLSPTQALAIDNVRSASDCPT